MELKLPLLKAEQHSDDDDGDKIVIDTSHEITYGDLGESCRIRPPFLQERTAGEFRSSPFLAVWPPPGTCRVLAL